MRKTTIEIFFPPVLLRAAKRLLRRHSFSGNYVSWHRAEEVSTGYDAELILEKVKQALLKVKRGEVAYERDSVLFDHIEYSWPLIAGLLDVALRHDGRLSVLDFGGSPGSSYFQCRNFLNAITNVRWNIVEQENFVRCGKEFFEDERLRFFPDVASVVNNEQPNVALFSSVLQYLERPFEVVDEVVSRSMDTIIVDRTPLVENSPDRITVQHVSPAIYPASYPARFFNRKNFLAHFIHDYDMIAQFDSLAGEIDLGDVQANDSGFIFRKKIRGGLKG